MQQEFMFVWLFGGGYCTAHARIDTSSIQDPLALYEPMHHYLRGSCATSRHGHGNGHDAKGNACTQPWTSAIRLPGEHQPHAGDSE